MPLSNNISSFDAKSQFTSFYSRFQQKYDQCFKEEVDGNNKRSFITKPWCTLGIAKSCKMKNKLHNLWIKSRGKPNEAQAEFDFKVYRAKLRDIIKYQKNKYFTKRFNNCKGDIKKCWKVLNEIRNKRKQLNLPKFINFNGSLIANRRVILTEFNKYFVNIANNLNKEGNANNNEEFRKFMKNRNENSLFSFEKISDSEISDLIDDLNPNKKSDIYCRILQLFKHKLTPVLTILFNNCMIAGIFPDPLKIAKVLPLFKSGDKNKIENYRPISILPILSKIFEKLINKRMIGFFDENDVIYEKQFGFRKQHSTVHALNTAVTQILNSLNNNKIVVGVFLDFSKAFDTVVHNILI